MLKKILIFIAILLAYLPSASAQTLGTINTVAGGGPNNLPALQAGLGYPTAVVKDSSGNLYVGTGNYSNDSGMVFKIDLSGNLTIYAGNGANFYSITTSNGDGGPATSAILGYVGGLALDSQQNLYIADENVSTIRKVAKSTGIITTVAGNSIGTVCATASDPLGDNCPATSALLSDPNQIYVDGSGNIYITDTGDNLIREVVASTGKIQTVAGGGTVCTTGALDILGDGCAATSATLAEPTGVYVDSHNNIYIADTFNNRIRVVNAGTGIILSIAGNGVSGFSGDGAAATAAEIYFPKGLFVDAAGNLYFADSINSRIREVFGPTPPSGQTPGFITTLAGGGVGCTGQTDNYGDGCVALDASFSNPLGIFVDSSNNIYITDQYTFLVREVVASSGDIQAVAGNGTPSFSGDGYLATDAELNQPYSIAVDPVGDIYIADFANERIRRVDAATHTIQTVAGGGTSCPAETDDFGDGCPATQATIFPFTAFVDGSHNIYFTDYSAARIRRVDGVTGIITSVAGGGTGSGPDCPNPTDALGDNCPAADTVLYEPWGIYVDANGNIFFTDLGDARVREVVASTGKVQSIAGTGTAGYNGDNIPATLAEVDEPIGIYGDTAGNIYFSDFGNFRIREIVASSGNIVTVAGTGTVGYNGDNIPATTADIFEAYGVYVDQAANIFFGDYGNGRVREVVAATGLIQTVAGNGTIGFGGDGGPATSASLSFMADVGGDFAGDLYIADTFNNRIREVYGIVPANNLVVTTQTLPPGQVGTPYSFGMQAAGGALPYSWTLLSGSLPQGFSPLSTSGVLSGTATVANTYFFSVQVTDAGGHIATQALSLIINPVTTVTLESIAVTPVDPTVLKGAILPFTATGFYSDGSTQNLTSAVTWSSGTATVATINSSGVATGVGGGSSTIGATLGNVFGSTMLTVTTSHAYAYIGSVVSANCCLDVLDTTTNTVVGTIPLTGFGEPFGVTPDQSRLYIADYTDNLVNVVDTSLNALLTTIPVGQGPNAVAITPNGQFGYVANAVDTTVSVFSVASNTLVTTIQTGIQAENIAVTPDGKSVYIAGVGNSMAVISTSTNTVSSTFTLSVPSGDTAACCLFGPLLNPSGTLGYVVQNFSQTTPGSVSVISLPSNTTVASIPLGIAPFDAAITPDGTRLYVVNFGSNSVSVIDTASNTVIATVPVGTGPQSVGITPDGTLAYVANTGSSTLSIIQTSTNTVINTVPMTTPFGILIPSPPVPSAAPVLTLSPVNVIFNGQPLGTRSTAQTIGVSNPGSSALTLSSIILTGPGASFFNLSNGCPVSPATLGAGLGCNVQVSFTPSTASTVTALVQFNYTNGEISSQQSVPLNGTGVTPTGATVSPSSLAFGSQTVSTSSAPQGITISNDGIGPLGILSLGVTGTNPGDFPMTTNCPIGGAGLASGSSCGVFVSFAPLDLGARTASVVVTYNQGGANGSQSVTLTGTGADVAVVASTTYNFAGNPFTTFTGAVTCPPDCNISGFFTVAQPLAPNLSNVSVKALNYAANVGTTTFTQANTTSGGFASISTDASGNIISWSITLSTTAASFSTVNLPTGSADTFTQVSPQGTASNAGVPSTWPTTTVTPLTFAVSTTPASNVVPLNCPSGTVPCTDPNAHSFKITIPAVSTAFTLTVTSVEVPLAQANGDCPAGQTEATNFNCRFVTYFNLGSDGKGGTLVPQCVPYSNGNCVFYRVSNTPPDGTYTQGIGEYIAWNNTSFTPSSFYNASNPQLYDDPDSPPYDINHQFVFDITQYFVSGGGQVGVDPGIAGTTKKFNDFVVAYPQAQTSPYTATVLTPVGTPSVATGSTLPVAFTLQQNSAYTGNALVAPNVVTIGVVNSSGVKQPTIDPATGLTAVFLYNASVIPPQYQLNLSTLGYAPGTYQLFINSNLFPQVAESFTVTAPVTLQSLSLTPVNPSIVINATVQFTATGHYSDGSTQNLTNAVNWSSGTLTVATISGTGLATGAGIGNSTITATTGNIFAQTVLTVIGTAPPTAMIGISPTSLTFANQIVSTMSTPMVINVSSTGTAALLISNIAVTGTNPGDFVETTNCPIGGAGLAPGNPCGIFVNFAPTDIGARSASVVITDNQNNITGSQQSVTLSGTGVDVPVVASTTYNITGNPFTFFSGSAACPPDCNIIGSFTLAQPLAPNLSLATITPTAFSFSVGPNVLTQNSAAATFNDVSTDASGNITGWDITISNTNFTIVTFNVDGKAADSFEMSSPQGSATNSGAPATWPKTTVTPLTFAVSTTPVSNMVPLNCPSGTVPCTDPNAHSFKVTIPAVSSAFTLTVTSVEVPLAQANGDCPAGQTEATNFNCRFVTYFNLGSDGNGGTLVPQCVPYSNGNCVFYRVSNTPPDGTYTQGIGEYIAWNNTSFTPSSFYNASNPQLYDDPDSPPYDINHQFVFDITQYFVSGGGQVGIDPGIAGTTKKFNDFVVAYPAASTTPYTATVVSPVGTPSVTAGATLPVAFTLQQNSAYTGNALVAPNAVSVGVLNSAGVRQPTIDPATGVLAVFVYNSSAIPPQYQLNISTTGYAPGTYQLLINSNLFAQLVANFTVAAPVTLQTISVTPAQRSIAVGATQQFTATGFYSDGSTQNLTSSVTWSSNPTTVATINTTGLATGAGQGTATITASLGTIIASTTLVVTQSAPPTAMITINPGSLAFANQIVSTMSTPMVINVSSTGTAALLISNIAVSGTNPGDFPMTTNCPIGGAGLAPGASPCGIFVNFAPTDLGARTASVVITDNQNNITGSQQSVTLSGTGTDVSPVAATTYQFTSNPFNEFSGAVACLPDCNIMGSFTLARSLAPNLSNATITPASFSFSVGPNVLDQNSATSASFTSISTDGSGNITNWVITLANANLTISTSNFSDTAYDSFQSNSPQGAASNGGSPVGWPKTTVTPLSFPVSTTPVTNVATLNCPSGTVPCTDPFAHSFKLTIPAVSSAFTLTVTSFEVPLSLANGDCPAGQTEATNFNCRFVTYFNLGSDGKGGTLVPQCVPYSNGNCVFYRVSNTPTDGTYTQGIGEYIAWNNTSYTPPSFYDANNPRLYDDPDSAPYDINHQFVFDITQYFVTSAGQVGVDPGIAGTTKKFNDFVVAYPQAQTNPYTATALTPVGSPSTATGTALPVAFTLQQSGGYTGNALVAPNVVTIGVVNSAGVKQATLDPSGAAAAFVYNASANPPQYQLNLSTQGYAPGTYQLFINSNLFSQLVESFTVTAAGPFVSFGLASQNPYSIATGSGGSYIVTINFVNIGNVTVSSCTLTGGTLGSASMTSFTGGPCTNVLPGSGFTFSATFPSSAGAAGAGVAMQVKGTYTAGTLNGNWTQTFRKVVLP